MRSSFLLVLEALIGDASGGGMCCGVMVGQCPQAGTAVATASSACASAILKPCCGCQGSDNEVLEAAGRPEESYANAMIKRKGTRVGLGWRGTIA